MVDLKMLSEITPCLQILDVIRVGVDKGPKEGYEAEANGFGELAMTPHCKGLIGLFKGQTECKKNRFGKSEVGIKTVRICFYNWLHRTARKLKIIRKIMFYHIYNTLVIPVNKANFGFYHFPY